MRGSPTAELVFRGLRSAGRKPRGTGKPGSPRHDQRADVERIVLAGGSIGMAQQALDYSIRYAVEREQFGHAIAHFQMIQQKLADMYARTEPRGYRFTGRPIWPKQAPRGGKGTELTRLAAAAILLAAENGHLGVRPGDSDSWRLRRPLRISGSKSCGEMPNSMKSARAPARSGG